MNNVLRITLIVAGLGLAVGGLTVGPQVARAQGQASQTARDPDWQAYDDALRISDPARKVAALEKFMVNYPDSDAVWQAHADALSIYVRDLPEQKQRILTHARRILELRADDDEFLFEDNTIITLIQAGVLLDEVERLFRKAAAAYGDESSPMRSLRSAEATYQLMIGRIRSQQGDTRAAGVALQAAYDIALPYAYRPDFKDTFKAAALNLAEFDEKRGDYAGVLDRLALVGNLDAAAKQRLETAYRKTHHDSLDGLDALIDARYERAFPNPIKAEPYRPTPARSDRTALVEVFSGSWCPPCAATSLAFDSFLQRYSATDLTVLVYHIRNDDPMQNPSTRARETDYKVTGVPTVRLDGDNAVGEGGGGLSDQAQIVYDRILAHIDRRLEKPADASIALKVKPNGSIIDVSATVTPLRLPSGLRLQIALVEEGLRFTGSNGTRFHPMVVRNMAENAAGFALAEKPVTVSWRFDLDAISQQTKKALDDLETGSRNVRFSEKMYAMNPNNLTVVAFVQDEKTREVLQSVSVKVAKQGRAE